MKKEVVLITGVSRGIGKALAEKLHKKGYIVYGGMRECKEIVENNFIPISLDLTSEESMVQAVHHVLEKEGTIDVLYHVAGEAYYCPAEGMTVAEVRHMYEVNLFGPFRLTQIVLPKMRERNKGRIIFTSSIRALAPCEFMGLYSGSKAALETMAWDLYLTLNQWNIQVVVVEPGPVDSGIVIKEGSYFSEQHPYRSPENVYLEWQTLDSVVDPMLYAVKVKNPPFRFQTSLFAQKVVKNFLTKVLEDEFVDFCSE